MTESNTPIVSESIIKNTNVGGVTFSDGNTLADVDYSKYITDMIEFQW